MEKGNGLSFRAVLAMGLLLIPVYARSATVPGQFPTIQQAINAVVTGSLPSGTVIEVQPGTYFEALSINATAVSMTVRGAGAGATIVNATGKSLPVISIRQASGSVRFEGFTATGGIGGPGSGGGFVVEDASPTFANCAFQGNSSTLNGGGGVLTRSNAIFDNCSLRNNSAAQYGGGVLITTGSRPVFRDCTIQNNTSGTSSNIGGGGGVVINDASPTFKRCSIVGNNSKFAGGGLFHLGPYGSANGTATLVMEDCLIANNTTSRFSVSDNPAEGGGIHIEDNAVARLTRSLISGNQANTGGGLNMYRARYEINDSIIQFNSAIDPQHIGGFGGGISGTSNNTATPFRPASAIILKDSVVRNNVSDVAGGILAVGDQVCAGGPCGIANLGTIQIAVLNISNSLVDNNTSDKRGGGFLADRSTLTVAKSQIIRNQVTGDSESFGGGAMIVGGTNASISDSTIAANSARQFGGGLFIDQAANVNVNGSQVYKNSVGSTSTVGGSGVFVGETIGPSTGVIQNSIIADNQGPQISELTCSGNPSAISYLGNNIISESGSDKLYTTSCAPAAGGISNISTFNGLAKANANVSLTPRFARFSATPTSAPSVLAFAVARPTGINITHIGPVTGPVSTRDVSPSCSTNYLLTASTATGSIGPLHAAVTAGSQPMLLRMTDYDGDGSDDVAVWRPCGGRWYISNSSGPSTSIQWGAPTDIPVPGDYDGDGVGDVAVWRPSTGTWHIIRSTAGNTAVQWGAPGDVPVPADYDGDGSTDIAVWRPTNGRWYLIRSTAGVFGLNYGAPGDKPVPADYDGDGSADIAVWRPTTGTWYLIRSTAGTAARNWGAPTDIPVPADYDGDGSSDIAVWRPSNGTWYMQRTTAGLLIGNYGAPSDVPVPADYDGDGKADRAVWRPDGGRWYLLRTLLGGTTVQWGSPADIPVP